MKQKLKNESNNVEQPWEEFLEAARFFVSTGDISQAHQAYTQVLEMQIIPVALYERGQLYLSQENYTSAILDLSHALEKVLDPQIDNSNWFKNQDMKKEIIADIYNQRACSYIGLKKGRRALQDMKKSVSIYPKNWQYHYNLAMLYTDLEMYIESLHEFDEVLRLNPDHIESLFNRNNCHTNMQDYEKAIDGYSQCIFLYPEIDLSFYHRGNLYAQLGKFEKAKLDYESYISSNPDNANAIGNLSFTLLNMMHLEPDSDMYDKWSNDISCNINKLKPINSSLADEIGSLKSSITDAHNPRSKS